jgi:hypothetical protein
LTGGIFKLEELAQLDNSFDWKDNPAESVPMEAEVAQHNHRKKEP